MALLPGCQGWYITTAKPESTAKLPTKKRRNSRVARCRDFTRVARRVALAPSGSPLPGRCGMRGGGVCVLESMRDELGISRADRQHRRNSRPPPPSTTYDRPARCCRTRSTSTPCPHSGCDGCLTTTESEEPLRAAAVLRDRRSDHQHGDVAVGGAGALQLILDREIRSSSAARSASAAKLMAAPSRSSSCSALRTRSSAASVPRAAGSRSAPNGHNRHVTEHAASQLEPARQQVNVSVWSGEIRARDRASDQVVDPRYEARDYISDVLLGLFIVSATTGSAHSAENMRLNMLRERVVRSTALGGALLDAIYSDCSRRLTVMTCMP
jgi:hypothetical protein